jgi:GNAT superfamily N-acetyltransferase
MDGNTWNRYRFVTERGDEPPFFLEPDNPDDYPGHWLEAGFSPLANYYSALTTQLDLEDPRTAEIEARLRARGIVLRTLRPDEFDEELRRLHRLSLASFAGNFLYTPIGEDEFLAQYRPIRPRLRPELVLLAEQGGRLAGFIFAVPDLLQARRSLPIDTAIAKTMAVHPDAAGIGLGSYLMGRLHRAVRACGYGRVIHAMFHESNNSGKISRHTAQVIRRYTLFARPLRERG